MIDKGFTKQELSCESAIPILQYLESQCGAEETKQAVEEIGLPLSYLYKKNNWISYHYYNLLLETMVRLTDDPRAPYMAPLHTKTSEIFDFLLYATQNLFWHGSPKFLYRQVLKSQFYRRFTKIGTFQIENSTSASIDIRLTLHTEHPQTRYNCDSVQGLLASVPMGMGLGPGRVEEKECAVNGSSSCLYTVSWQNRHNYLGLVGSAISLTLFVLMLIFPQYIRGQQFLLTVISIVALTFASRSYQYQKALKQQETVDLKRNDYLVDNLRKLEYSYNTLLQTKQKLEKSNRTIDSILSSIPSLVVIFNSETFRIDTANQAFLQTHSPQYNTDTLRGSLLFDVLQLDDNSMHIIKETAPRLRQTIPRTQIHEASIGKRAFEYTIFPLQHSQDGMLAGIILTDVTQTKIFEQKLLTNHKLLALGKIASGIAHEINNPLYAILANAEEISEISTSNSDARQYADEVVELSLIISDVIKELSLYSRTMHTDKVRLENLNEIIQQSLKLVCYGSNIMGIQITKELQQVPLIPVARGEIQQIFINLFTNAIEAMNRQGTLRIESGYHAGQVYVRIHDTGRGIPSDVLPHIFEYYFTTKGNTGGSGQGLAIVERLTQKNNGRIQLEQTTAHGTTFLLEFATPSTEEQGDHHQKCTGN